MRTSTLIATTLAAGSAVSAVPVKRETNFGGVAGPLGSLLGDSPIAPVAGSAQGAVGDLFKVGDEILNIPGDAIRKILEGNPIGAGTGLIQDVVKAGTDIPGDVMSIISPLAQGLNPNAGKNTKLDNGQAGQQAQQAQQQESQDQESKDQQQADYMKQANEALDRAEKEAKELGETPQRRAEQDQGALTETQQQAIEALKQAVDVAKLAHAQMD